MNKNLVGNKTNFKIPSFGGVWGGFFLLFLFFLSCSNGNEPGSGESGNDDKLVKLDVRQSFTLLSINASRGLSTGEYSIDGLNELVQEYNPDVIAMQEVDFRTNAISGQDMVTEIAYRSVVNSQPRQGLFTPIMKADGGERGLGLFVKGLFEGTERVVLDNGLILHTINYTLISKREIIVATCEFNAEDREKMLAQAETLNAYAENLKKELVIAVSLYADTDSEVIKTLETKYRRSCKFNAGKTYPAQVPAYRYTYILTPLSQTNWGTEYVNVVGDESVLNHKGVLVKIGFTK